MHRSMVAQIPVLCFRSLRSVRLCSESAPTPTNTLLQERTLMMGNCLITASRYSREMRL